MLSDQEINTKETWLQKQEEIVEDKRQKVVIKNKLQNETKTNNFYKFCSNELKPLNYRFTGSEKQLEKSKNELEIQAKSFNKFSSAPLLNTENGKCLNDDNKLIDKPNFDSLQEKYNKMTQQYKEKQLKTLKNELEIQTKSFNKFSLMPVLEIDGISCFNENLSPATDSDKIETFTDIVLIRFNFSSKNKKITYNKAFSIHQSSHKLYSSMKKHGISTRTHDIKYVDGANQYLTIPNDKSVTLKSINITQNTVLLIIEK